MSSTPAQQWRVVDADEVCADPAAAAMARVEAAAPEGGDKTIRLSCGGREFMVRVCLERSLAGEITTVNCEVADGVSGDLLRAADVRPRIRMTSLAALDPWTRTAVRQTLRQLLAAAAGGDAPAVS